MPSFVVGLTIASLGTSLPEVATNLSAAFHSSQGSDASGIAIGNVVGSCISQITLLLGITGLAAPMVLPRRMLTRDGSAALFAILALGLAALDGVVERWEGGLLVACYATYLWIVYRTEPRGAAADRSDEALGPVLLRGAAGLLVVLLAAQVIVDQGVERGPLGQAQPKPNEASARCWGRREQHLTAQIGN